MSRPTAMQRAQAEAQHTKALTTYAELGMAVDMLDGVATREYARFGPETLGGRGGPRRPGRSHRPGPTSTP